MAALEALQELVRLEPDDEDRKRELMDVWEARRNPIEALRVRETLEEPEGDDNTLDLSAYGLPSGLVVPAGATITIMGPGGSFTVTGGESDDDRPSMARIKEELEAGDVEAARRIFRRLWRRFSAGEDQDPYGGSIIYFASNAPSVVPWPEDPAEEDEEEEEPSRGGLEDYEEEEEPPPPERESAFRVLARHAFGLAEIEAQLRSKSARELEAAQPLLDALLHGRTERDGGEPVLAELLGRVRAGHAGKVDYVLLLVLLDVTPERSTADTEEVLGDLARTLSPTDTAQLRRLARVHARLDAREEAARIYRWCATRTQDVRRYVFDDEGGISAQELVKEVKENLEGDERVAVTEAILSFSDPGDDRWARASHEALVLDTWTELLGPAAALERCRPICAAVTDHGTGLRREVAARAAALYARGGELERALACLETAVCELDPALFPAEFRRFNWAERPGYLDHAELRRLFPAPSTLEEEWPAAADWYRAAAAALEGWLAEDRVALDNTAQALALAALRLHQAGDTEGGRAILERLQERDDLSPARSLWVADAARELGASELADAVEARLFEERRLHVERVPELVARVLASEGPAAALALGERAAELTLHPDLLELLVEAAEAAGDAAATARWRATADEARAAREALRAPADGPGESEEDGGADE